MKVWPAADHWGGFVHVGDVEGDVLGGRHVPGGVGGLDAVAEAVGRRLEVVLGDAGSGAGGGDADLAVGPYGVEAVGTGAGVGGAEAVAGDTDVVGGRYDGNHGAGSLVLGVVEGLAGADDGGLRPRW